MLDEKQFLVFLENLNDFNEDRILLTHLEIKTYQNKQFYIFPSFSVLKAESR